MSRDELEYGMNLNLVSTNSQNDIDRNRTKEVFEHNLRELAANLLRIIRGAGKPYCLLSDMADCLESVAAYYKAHGCVPDSEVISLALDPDRAFEEERPWMKQRSNEDLRRWMVDGTFERMRRERNVRRAALQITASLLLNQASHLTKAKHEMIVEARRL